MSVSGAALRSERRSGLKQHRHLTNGSFEQVGSSLFGAPRVAATDDTLFGSAVSLSSNGMNLAVGASGHDVNPLSIGSGAVYFYDFNL
eukprot:CAMPEP_0194248816 /NCGR_PEP_ID=MMETSP0158-20130606/19175_1 /TAXON_ID=33649 /ORGANISM="Thalassionema nitzschioides, Strain L26-B" /LENGTH=87 /DNA_ID=CAMNT_0038985207 /DNA_START=144 /DNA_END=404 /DNA_ORIENTATION=-